MKWTKEQLRKCLTERLTKQDGLRRKELLESCMAALGYSAEQIADTRPESESVQLKIALGSQLSELIHGHVITEDAVGMLHAEPEVQTRFDLVEVREFLLHTLEAAAPLGKQKLFSLAEQHFGTDKTPSRDDDNALRGVVGRVLLALEKDGHLVKTQRGWRPASKDRYPATELGGWLRQAAMGGDVKKCFLEAIHTKGGEWFEYYCVNLMRSYYERSGKIVDAGSVTGGSNDGGIDGIIHTTDDLGYRETILMQMKNRHVIMTPKDLREFYGAVCAEHGTRGIFISLGGFHIEAQRFIERVDNLTGLDGDRLFEIAGKCGMGLREQAGRMVLDDDFFLKE